LPNPKLLNGKFTGISPRVARWEKVLRNPPPDENLQEVGGGKYFYDIMLQGTAG